MSDKHVGRCSIIKQVNKNLFLLARANATSFFTETSWKRPSILDHRVVLSRRNHTQKRRVHPMAFVGGSLLVSRPGSFLVSAAASECPRLSPCPVTSLTTSGSYFSMRKRRLGAPNHNSILLTPREVDELYGPPFTIAWLERKRRTGNGPPFLKAGEGKTSKIYYRASDIEAWIEENLRTSSHRDHGGLEMTAESQSPTETPNPTEGR